MNSITNFLNSENTFSPKANALLESLILNDYEETEINESVDEIFEAATNALNRNPNAHNSQVTNTAADPATRTKWLKDVKRAMYSATMAASVKAADIDKLVKQICGPDLAEDSRFGLIIMIAGWLCTVKLVKRKGNMVSVGNMKALNAMVTYMQKYSDPKNKRGIRDILGNTKYKA